MPEETSKPTRHLLRQSWLEWSDSVLPKGLNADLVDRIRSAYYFGAIAVHQILWDAMTSDVQPKPGEPNILDELQAEFVEFDEEVPQWFRESIQ